MRRAVRVLAAPREVFEALRDDSIESAGDRQDVVVVLAFVGGVAAALATASAGALDDLDAEHPDQAEVLELRRVLYGLHAILRLHFAQEEEGYFSLLDESIEPVGGSSTDGAAVTAGR